MTAPFPQPDPRKKLEQAPAVIQQAPGALEAPAPTPEETGGAPLMPGTQPASTSAPVSLEALKKIFPKLEEEKLYEMAGMPKRPLGSEQLGALASGDRATIEANRKQYLDYIQRKSAFRTTEEGKRQTDEGTRIALDMAAATATGALMPARAVGTLATGAAVGGAVGLTDFLTRTLLQEEETETALPNAAVTGAMYGAGELAVPLAVAAGATGYYAVRHGARAISSGWRNFKGLEPKPDLPYIERITKPFEKFVGGQALADYYTLKELGGVATPGQYIEHMLARSATKIAEKSPASAQRMSANNALNEKLASDAIQEVVDSMPKVSRSHVGGILNGITTGRYENLKGAAKAYYEYIEKMTGGGKMVQRNVPDYWEYATDPVTGIAEVRQVAKVVEEWEPKVGVEFNDIRKRAVQHFIREREGLRNNPKLEKMLIEIINKPDKIGFQQAAHIRSQLFELSKQFQLEGTETIKFTRGVAQDLATNLTRSLHKSAKEAGEGVYNVYRKANAIWGQEIKGELTNKFIAKLARDQPEDVLDAVLNSGDPTDIRRIRSIVMKEKPEAWTRVQSAWLNRMLYDHTDPATDRIKADAILDSIHRVAREDGSNLRALFPGGDQGSKALEGFKRYVNVLGRIQRPLSGEGFGSTWIQLGSAFAASALLGSAAGAVTGGVPTGLAITTAATGAVYFAMPHLIGRAFTNPEFVKWMIVGAKYPPGSVAGTRAAMNIASMALREGWLPEFEREKAQDFIATAAQDLTKKKAGGTKQ